MASGLRLGSRLNPRRGATDWGQTSSLIIVTPDQFDLSASLTDHFVAHEETQVLLDHPQGNRYTEAQPPGRDLRGTDRGRSSSTTELREQHSVIVRPRNGFPLRGLPGPSQASRG